MRGVRAENESDHARIAQCIDKCDSILDDEQELRLGECAERPTCHEIESCVLATPGA
ncbi:hypothetical protein DB30_00039 [Enhygromyxa salina]|uniref:Uncharacterized protein n=1 Tax=Enhygromyxa salina TaxID=215803 RepID=A0A0C2DDK1_9BACT|nr:hypothetical protein DB30_00039 [Enhygromyxa salina]